MTKRSNKYTSINMQTSRSFHCPNEGRYVTTGSDMKRIERENKGVYMSDSEATQEAAIHKRNRDNDCARDRKKRIESKMKELKQKGVF